MTMNGLPALVLLTFDIHDANSEDYAYVTAQLRSMGFEKQMSGENGQITFLPNNTYAAQVAQPRDAKAYAVSVRTTLLSIIGSRNRKSQVYVVVAPIGWGWAAGGA